MRRGFFFLWLGAISCVFAQDSIDLEPIVIEKDNASFHPASFRSDDIDALPLASLEQVLDYSSGSDLKQRSSQGIQQDLSIRGSIFEDNKVLINGIEVNDPQTGHFSLEIPFTAADIEEVVIDKNGQAVSFDLKRPGPGGLFLESSFGEHALSTQLVSVDFPLLASDNRLSLEHARSKGARQDTDFTTYTATLHSYYHGEEQEVEWISGFLKKDFGAGGFYAAPLFMQEEEHTLQYFTSLRWRMQGSGYDLEITPYFRRHDDDFILNRRNPGFFNAQHTTFLYGSEVTIDFKELGSSLVSGFRQEKIASSNLGKHTRDLVPLALRFDPLRIGDLVIEAEAGGDHYSDWDWLESFHLATSFLLDERARIGFSFDRLYRVPSFTELFYLSPANRGNPGLSAQRMDNFQWSFILDQERFDVDVDLFLRRQADTIDWVRNSPIVPWQARNVGEIDARGAEVGLEFLPQWRFLSAVGLSYSFLDLERGSTFAHSKYVFNSFKHRVLFKPEVSFGEALTVMPFLSFEKPLRGNSRVILDLTVVCEISDAVSLFLEGKNLLGRRYEEIEGVEADPRWFRAGVTFEM